MSCIETAPVSYDGWMCLNDSPTYVSHKQGTNRVALSPWKSPRWNGLPVCTYSHMYQLYIYQSIVHVCIRVRYVRKMEAISGN